MEVTDVRLKLNTTPNAAKLKACASVTFDHSFVVHNVRLIHDEERRFIAMPCSKTADGKYVDIAHPLNSETRKMIEDAVFKAYNEALAEGEQAAD